jgi:hypothetical protein
MLLRGEGMTDRPKDRVPKPKGTSQSTQPQCPGCGQGFPTEAELDDHVLAARHWEE